MNKTLNFQVWLRDKTQKGFVGITNRLRGLQREARITKKAWSDIGVGAASVWAVGQTMQALTGPAREMNAARGELNSLLDEKGSSTLNQVQIEGMKFASAYGKSAAEFVRASYDIQSAISGLTGNELAKFTRASAILATATKADTVTITSYMGTMYGAFKTTADKMGKAQWVEQIAGQTAVAVKMFKTTGSAMNEAFSGLGTRASNQNISSAEQFAILGMAQAGKTGSTAGTAYAGFMDALPNAQQRLKINFAGDDGKALGMVAVIDKLKAKLGDELSVNVVGHLNTAFGTVASGLIQDLWHQTDVLSANIASLDKVSNMNQAMEMAAKIADPWSMLGQTVNNVRVIFGQALDAVLMPTILFLTNGFQVLQEWMVTFPELTTAVAWFAYGLVSLGAVVASVTILTASFTIAKLGLIYTFGALKLALLGVTKPFIWLAANMTALTIKTWASVTASKALIITTLRLSAAYLSLLKGSLISFIGRITASLWAGVVATKTLTIATISAGRASLAAFGASAAARIATMAAATVPLLLGMLSLIPAAWSLAVAFFAAIGWVPVLITAVVVGVGLLIAKWDELTTALSNTKWFAAIKGTFNYLIGYLDKIGKWFDATWSRITGLFYENDLNTSIDQQLNVINEKLPISGNISTAEPSTIPTHYSQVSNQNQANNNSIGTMNINTTYAPGLTDLNSYMSLRTP
ncbi:phage tail tape measure protein [Aliivibrio fischeri]|uniref:Phage tail tape measure protein domain-containing protein n=1 Tax=Aliivibrio fischeri TaxID=668 RepID=A0A510UF96_ALIFS|nr:phage tail tape measure protein [Aliivibrio fischeri]GEK13216.1 hypothetical protein AFI02nite_12520 [Aliivibrio fischeri]